MTSATVHQTRTRLHFRDHRTSSVLTGASLVVMALVAGFAYGYLHPQMWAGAVAQTNQAEILAMFRMEILCWWFIVLLDLVVSVGIYVFFRSSSRTLSAAAMVARLGYTAVLLAAVIALTAGWNSGPDEEGLRLFETLWSRGLVVFGAHLVVLAILAWNGGGAPKTLSAILGLGGLGYLVVHGLRAFPGTPSQIAGALEPVLALPMALGELWLALWLIHGFFRTGNREVAA